MPPPYKLKDAAEIVKAKKSNEIASKRLTQEIMYSATLICKEAGLTAVSDIDAAIDDWLTQRFSTSISQLKAAPVGTLAQIMAALKAGG